MRILDSMLRGSFGLVLIAAVGCARPPSAPVQAVRPLTPDELAYLAPAERQAHVLARACERDDASACERLGGAYWVGNGVPQHKFHALALWTYACERGIGTACEEAAKQYDHGELVPVDGTRATALYAAGCNAGRGTACTRLGELDDDGRWATPSPRRASRWYRKACDRGDAAGCHALGLAMLEGRGVSRDTAAALELLDGACGSGHAVSCRQLGVLHEEGMFATKDIDMAGAYRRRACEAGDGPSCTELGLRARTSGDGDEALARLSDACDAEDPRGCALLGDMLSLGTPSDPASAATMYGRACRGGLWEACGRAAALVGAGGIDEEELRELYTLACDAGAIDACDYLAGMLLDGVGGPKDPQMAAVLYDRACISENSESCVHLAWMGRHDGGDEPLAWLVRACELDEASCVVLGEVHERKMVEGARPAAAIEAYQRGCAADHADACFRLAGVHARGVGTKRDDAVAARLYQVACDGGEADGCAALSAAFRAGEGVAKDPLWADHYRAKACELGLASACSDGTRLTARPKSSAPPAR